MTNKIEKALGLSKGSNNEQIKAYFAQVFNLKNSGEEFPVDLEDVFPLLYGMKHKAVNELVNAKDEFGNKRYYEGIDYQTLNQTVQAGKHNKTVKKVYKLSLTGLEWFIARKVRPVFEVYRQLAHSYIEGSLQYKDKKFISRKEYCERFNKSMHSFNALFGHYPMEFMYAQGIWSISTDLCKKVEFENKAKAIKQKIVDNGGARQLSMNLN